MVASALQRRIQYLTKQDGNLRASERAMGAAASGLELTSDSNFIDRRKRGAGFPAP
jgi:hypothetical protein